MKVSLYPFYGESFKNNNIFSIDHINIFFNFKKLVKQYGIEINTDDVKTKFIPDKFVYCDVPYPWKIYDWLRLLLHINKNVLFCFESPIVNPLSQFKVMRFFFKKIYTWNDDLVDNKKFFKFYIPQLSEIGNKIVKFEDKRFLIMVNSKKTARLILRILSGFKADLYAERLRAINFFEDKRDLLDLYGAGWDSEGKKNYKGDVDYNNKSKILSLYKYCLCFENTIAPGYISEKIIDCFKAHTVPIYFGVENIEKYVPKNCFIDFRNFKGYQSLLDYLKNIDEKTYSEYINNGKKLLETKKFVDTWFEGGFLRVFLESISFTKNE